MTKDKRPPPRSFPESLRDLKRALAEAQYAATVTDHFPRDAADEHLKTLETIRNQLGDLTSFIKRQSK